MALPFNPASLSTLILWLDASDPASLVTSGSSVIQWRDKSIYQNHTVISSTTAPLLSSINSISSVYFNSRSGTPQYFQGPLSTLATQQSSFGGFQSSFHMFIVATMTSTCVRNFNRSLFLLGSNTCNVDGLYLYQFQEPLALGLFPSEFMLSTATTQYTTLTATSAWINYYIPIQKLPAYNQAFQCSGNNTLSFLDSGVTVYQKGQFSVNGSLPQYQTFVSYSNLNARRYGIGGAISGVPDARTCWDGHIGEILLYSLPVASPFTNDQVQEVQGYLAKKWGLESQLVPSHPYKSPTIQLSTLLSAASVDLTSTTKVFTLPSSSATPSQLLWLRGKNASLSTVTLLPQATDSINTASNTNLQITPQFQTALVANNGSNGWTVQSRFGGSISNLGYAPYTYFAIQSTIGSLANNFGFSLAVNSNSRYLAVAAPTLSTSAGLIYMYSKNTQSDTWVNTQRFAASDTTANMGFGTSLCMSYDGTYVLVGSGSNDIGGVTDVGAAYMFKKDPVSDLWNQVQKLTASDVQQNMFLADSNKSAMSQDATVVALASWTTDYSTPIAATDQGAVYMFTKNPSIDSWSQVQKIAPPYLVVPTGTNFGTCISLSADGSYLVVGARNYSFLTTTSYGAAFVYKRVPGTDSWAYLQGLNRNDLYQSANALGYAFGSNVAISGDGTTIVVTQSNTARYAYIFKKRTATDYFDRIQCLTSRATTSTYFGFTCAINYDGSFLALGTGNGTINGAILLYKKQTFTDLWTQYSPSNFYSTVGTYGTAIAMDSNCTSFFVAGRSSRILEYRQSTMTVTSISSSFLTVDTRSQKGTILLPPASAVPGQMFWIKDSGNNAIQNPISISTPLSTFLMSNYNGLFSYENNVSMQFQSDGISNYNLLSYFNGDTGTPISSSIFYVPFSLKKNTLRPTLNSSFTFRIPIAFTDSPNFFIDATTGAATIPRQYINSFDNIYFKSYDNQTILPHWCQPSTWVTATSCNFFFVKIPYIDFSFTPYYLYWDSNYIAQKQPFSTFDLFDDFSSAPGGQPDPQRWNVQLKGSGASVSQTSDGFMTLQGSDNQNASANLVSRLPILTGNAGRTYLTWWGLPAGSPGTTYNCNSFVVMMNYFCTDAGGTILGVGARSTLQDAAGAQSDWSITTLTEGACYYASTVTRHLGFTMSTNRAVVTAASDLVTSFAPSTTWTTLRYENSRIFQNEGTTQLFSNSASNQVSNLYIHVGQTSKVGFPAGKLFINYIAAYNVSDYNQNPDEQWGDLNTVFFD